MVAVTVRFVLPKEWRVDEKDTRAIQALAVSPIRVSEYAAARSLLATVLAAIVSAAASHIMVGQSINLLRLLALAALSAPLTALVGILTGLFSHNQITAIAILKIAMPAYLAIPLGAIFVPERLQFLFYALPNYWQLEALKTLYVPSLAAHDFWLSALLTLATGALFLFACGLVTLEPPPDATRGRQSRSDQERAIMWSPDGQFMLGVGRTATTSAHRHAGVVRGRPESAFTWS
ncbi:MAG: ABC transporter permease [Bacteroidota bacterium]